ncbi:hypothetical protein MUK42_03766 [Musa troglodytarum]|uniref:Uncharacterized protein n=1 Tax=Musa troglodytarum TaxID=320322 RepID=A0A9E7GEA3_9LILI|nr:hypothetical protein MUK42_03766 [Musa troglodytarum]
MKPLKIEEMVAKKLALWHTTTFRPIITHDELEPIMASAGFVPLPVAAAPPSSPEGAQQTPLAWREYASRSEAACRGRGRRSQMAPPRPRLPYPRIDGLHLMAYKAFLLALEFYLGPTFVPNLFHVRTMSLTRVHDRVFERAYRPMKDFGMDEEGIVVYREGTLDCTTKMVCSQYSSDDIDDTHSCPGNSMEKKRDCADDVDNAADLSCLVPLKDLFPSRDKSTS